MIPQGGRPVQILNPNRVQKHLGVWEGGRWVGWLAAGVHREGGQWVPQHTYLKMIPMTR